MEADDAGMACTQGCEGIALGNGGVHFVIACEMGFLEDLDGIWVGSDGVCGLLDL